MKIAIRAAVGVPAAVLLGAPLLAAGAWWAVTGGLYGCSAADERLGPRLIAEHVLPVPPADLQAEGPAGSGGCDEDDRHVEVWQEYRSAGPAAEVTERYRAAVLVQGWRPCPDARASDEIYCREAAGTTVSLRFGWWGGGGGFSAVLTAVPG
ncbi:hypothetical protein [Kitasatospora sp. NPDC088346]|uniref:hypothetical protein n=1 Tax=Kitasatospora sp. NPDC088346 TaxID=3364073 RepID=UPI00382AB73A